MFQLHIAITNDLEKVARYLSKVNSCECMRSAYIGKEKNEILEYLQEIYNENNQAILFVENESELIGAVAGDVCPDSHSIEVIGPFINTNIAEREQYFEKMILVLKSLMPGFKLQFFLDVNNTFIGQMILKHNGRKTKQHWNMTLELSNWEHSQDLSGKDKNCIQYMDSSTEQESIKYQIQELHNRLFHTSYYNGATIMKLLDDKHFINYCLNGARVVSYAFFNTEENGYLEFMGTDLNDCNKGYASALLQHVLEIVRTQNCTKLCLCVSAENGRAISVYDKAGFQIAEKNQAYILD